MAKKTAGAEAPKEEVAEVKDQVTTKVAKTAKVAKNTKPTARKSPAAKTAGAKGPKAVKAKLPTKKTGKKVVVDEKLMESVREQVVNVADEIKSSLAESIRVEYRTFVAQELRRMDRRRRWNNFFHDIVIILFAVLAVYFGYCLYEVHYFDFMKTECERDGTCETRDTTKDDDKQESAGPVKDATWYLANYSYLYDNLQTKLDADNVAAYYLYTDDRKVSDMKPEYLLAMAYNQIQQNLDPSVTEIKVSAEAMSQAFNDTFGAMAKFEKSDFWHGCLSFRYEKGEESFMAKNQTCELNKNREIVEKIERIYEEGEVIYIVTSAGVYDKTEQNFYRFDNLFQPVIKNAEKDSFDEHKTVLNRYQYQFKKNNDKYYFSGIVKLG